MKREVRKLRDQMARAYRLNTRGKRAFRRRFLKDYEQISAKVHSVVSAYAGMPINDDTRRAMLADLVGTLPKPAPVKFVQSAEASADGSMRITLTPEASRLFALA